MLSDAKIKKIEPKCDPTDLLLEKYNYDHWFEDEEPADATKRMIKKSLYIYLTCHH